MIMRALRPSEVTARHARVWDYSGAYRSDAFACDTGHSWDRVACIAGEYGRREISWRTARALLDDTIADAERSHARRVPCVHVPSDPPCWRCNHGARAYDERMTP